MPHRVMPPNQPHFVYNVHEAFAMGGHGLNWEALPLTEVSSRMDSLTATIANDVHGGFPSVIQAFALALPRNLKGMHSLNMLHTASHPLSPTEP